MYEETLRDIQKIFFEKLGKILEYLGEIRERFEKY